MLSPNIVLWWSNAWVQLKPALPELGFMLFLTCACIWAEWKYGDDDSDHFDGLGW